jgi:hypothetical protein
MTNRFFNLPENIISNIYAFDQTFHNEFKDIVMPELRYMMYRNSRWICRCDVCRNRKESEESTRLKSCFIEIQNRPNYQHQLERREKKEKKEKKRLENIEINRLELLRREQNRVLDEIKRDKNRIKNNNKKNKLKKNRII